MVALSATRRLKGKEVVVIICIVFRIFIFTKYKKQRIYGPIENGLS